MASLDPASESTPRRIDADLVIVGAGYAAMNGLNAAAKYLSPGSRVVVVDRERTYGGNWNRQYEYVRLHQPYSMFTAGDQEWDLGVERTHLASRLEVVDHLGSVPKVSAGHVDVQPLFRHDYSGHVVRGGKVELDATSLDGRESVRVRASRMLDARGFRIEPVKPWATDSTQVRSIAPSSPVLCTRDFLDDDKPVVVVGCGKTAMDTILYVAGRSSQRRIIHHVSGSGMWFAIRDHIYRVGLDRHFGGMVVTDGMSDMTLAFDGTNALEILHTVRGKGAVDQLYPGALNYRFGTMSRAELAAVREAVTHVHPGHLQGIDGTRFHVRQNGVERSFELPEHSWVVSCTTHLLDYPHQPLLQGGGLVCAPQNALGFTGPTAYFLTHAWYRGELAKVADRLFRIEFQRLPKLRIAFDMATMSTANLSMLLPLLPPSIPLNFRGDFGRWYPVHRRVAAALRFKLRGPRLIAKAETNLGTRFADPSD